LINRVKFISAEKVAVAKKRESNINIDGKLLWKKTGDKQFHSDLQQKNIQLKWRLQARK
jgi:hypothetical protein